MKADTSGLYWLSQTDATIYLEENWVPRFKVCALQPGDGQTRFGNVPVDTTIKAHWVMATGKESLIDETITFCPLYFDGWLATESSRTQNGLHYRNLHVSIDSTPTDEQLQLTQQLLALDDFAGGSKGRGISWLSDFLVSTVIHESTHAVGFVGTRDNRLSQYLSYV